MLSKLIFGGVYCCNLKKMHLKVLYKLFVDVWCDKFANLWPQSSVSCGLPTGWHQRIYEATGENIDYLGNADEQFDFYHWGGNSFVSSFQQLSPKRVFTCLELFWLFRVTLAASLYSNLGFLISHPCFLDAPSSHAPNLSSRCVAMWCFFNTGIFHWKTRCWPL